MDPLPGAGSHARKEHRPYPTAATLTKYRLSREDWAKLWDFQGGRCGICNRPPTTTLCIDHDHKTGKVRGLLHPLCNGKLGKVKDDIEWLRGAMAYLEDPPARRLDIQAVARTMETGRRAPRRRTRR